jgi:succinate dehydrogenase / fumarate reductase iron-sulfur subunit
VDKVTLEVVRSGGRRVRYDLKYRKGMTVLDALIEVREKQDSSLGYRHSCRMGICGSCGMNIEGVPRLACQAQISALKTEVVKLEPLHNMKVLKDLVVDLAPFITMHKSVRPHLVRKDLAERDHSDGEYKVVSEEVNRFLQFDYCIMCALCYSACPTVALDPAYLGPQAIAQAYRYMADPIQLARVEILRKRLLRKKTRVGSPLVPPAVSGEVKQGPKPPPLDFEKGAVS